MVTLHVSHKQKPEDVIKIAKGFLQKNIPVNLHPTNDKASKNILKEIELQGIEQVDVRKQLIRLRP
ncbi:MAG TPA: hypothetical protein PLJ57_05490 [Tepidanaerobacteraceae bacterium]|nr:hypothetical protein [Tepidanaerobacteraceae bacterium]